ncbi:MAG: GDSL-type esterase/lipase family protein [Solirubrobacterales bacterium]
MKRRPRAHFYGDSFTFGQGDPEMTGWVGRLAAKLPDVDFANHGSPGAPGFYIAQSFLRTEPDPSRTELAVFCLGTNDAVLRVPQTETIAEVERALDEAEARGWPVFWIGPPPIGDMPEEDRALRLLSAAIGETVSARDIPFAATFDELGEGSVWRAEARAADGSHPGPDGYAELAALLERAGLVDWIAKNVAR